MSFPVKPAHPVSVRHHSPGIGWPRILKSEGSQHLVPRAAWCRCVAHYLQPEEVDAVQTVHVIAVAMRVQRGRWVESEPVCAYMMLQYVLYLSTGRAVWVLSHEITHQAVEWNTST